MLGAGAKAHKVARSRERGPQLKQKVGVVDEAGKWHYDPVSGAKKLQYATARQQKKEERRKDRRIAELEERVAADSLRHAEEMEAERLRKRLWNEPGSSCSAFKRAMLLNAQPTLTTNLSSLQSLRASEGLAPNEVGENPERTSIQRVQRNIEFGVCHLLEPHINAMFVSFPLARLLSEVIRLSGWTEHGVAKDAAGHRDMVGAPVLGVGLTQDGASLMAADLGCVIEALKFTGYHMSTRLAGKAHPPGAADAHVGGQSARACILTGFLIGKDKDSECWL
ncbi:hypothetical protein B484DRAFT_409702 [Ochromonadaceae sp. CCMP2298]|nr:hypothetical protein B484DRAFT_409702 [Ochromonadaceae sp. CCMP2298]